MPTLTGFKQRNLGTPLRAGFQRFVAALGIGGLLAVAIVVAPVVPESASAYSTTGCRFASATIPYSTATPPSGYYLSNAQSDWSGNTDISGWAASGSIRAAFVFGSAGATGWSGLTTYNSCASSGGLHNNIVTVQINQYYTDAYSINGRISVMAHEIGHAIGLGHVGSGGGACGLVTVMNGFDSFRYNTCGVYQTTTDDRNGANALY